MPLCTIVVEGRPEYSGALITARLAIRFGREALWCPRQRHRLRQLSRPTSLIEQGAKLVSCGEQVLEELPLPLHAALAKPEQPPIRTAPAALRRVAHRQRPEDLPQLSYGQAKPLDGLVENTGLNSSDVLATLFELEMKGFVWQLPGKRFSKTLL